MGTRESPRRDGYRAPGRVRAWRTRRATAWAGHPRPGGAWPPGAAVPPVAEGSRRFRAPAPAAAGGAAPVLTGRTTAGRPSGVPVVASVLGPRGRVASPPAPIGSRLPALARAGRRTRLAAGATAVPVARARARLPVPVPAPHGSAGRTRRSVAGRAGAPAGPFTLRAAVLGPRTSRAFLLARVRTPSRTSAFVPVGTAAAAPAVTVGTVVRTSWCLGVALPCLAALRPAPVTRVTRAVVAPLARGSTRTFGSVARLGGAPAIAAPTPPESPTGASRVTLAPRTLTTTVVTARTAPAGPPGLGVASPVTTRPVFSASVTLKFLAHRTSLPLFPPGTQNTPVMVIADPHGGV